MKHLHDNVKAQYQHLHKSISSVNCHAISQLRRTVLRVVLGPNNPYKLKDDLDCWVELIGIKKVVKANFSVLTALKAEMTITFVGTVSSLDISVVRKSVDETAVIARTFQRLSVVNFWVIHPDFEAAKLIQYGRIFFSMCSMSPILKKWVQMTGIPLHTLSEKIDF